MNTQIVKTKTGYGIERGCRFCGSLKMDIIEGKPPHGKGLSCTGCGRHNGWLSKADEQLLCEFIHSGTIDLNQIMKNRDQAENLSIEAARTGDMPKYHSMIKLRDKYQSQLEEHSK